MICELILERECSSEVHVNKKIAGTRLPGVMIWYRDPTYPGEEMLPPSYVAFEFLKINTSICPMLFLTRNIRGVYILIHGLLSWRNNSFIFESLQSSSTYLVEMNNACVELSKDIDRMIESRKLKKLQDIFKENVLELKDSLDEMKFVPLDKLDPVSSWVSGLITSRFKLSRKIFTFLKSPSDFLTAMENLNQISGIRKDIDEFLVFLPNAKPRSLESWIEFLMSGGCNWKNTDFLHPISEGFRRLVVKRLGHDEGTLEVNIGALDKTKLVYCDRGKKPEPEQISIHGYIDESDRMVLQMDHPLVLRTPRSAHENNLHKKGELEENHRWEYVKAVSVVEVYIFLKEKSNILLDNNLFVNFDMGTRNRTHQEREMLSALSVDAQRNSLFAVAINELKGDD